MDLSGSTITDSDAIATALDAAKSALVAEDAVLHAVGPLYDDEGQVSPLFKTLVELAAVNQDCPLELHLIINDIGSSRRAVTAVQELGDAIGAARERAAAPCRIVVGSVAGAAYLVPDGDDWSGVKQVYDAIVAGIPMAATSVVATIESLYAQGLSDGEIRPTSFFGRGVDDGDGVVIIGDDEAINGSLAQAMLDREFCGFSRIKTPKLAWSA